MSGPNTSEITSHSEYYNAGSDSKIIATALAMVADSIQAMSSPSFYELESALNNLAHAIETGVGDESHNLQTSLTRIAEEIKYKTNGK